MVSHADKPIVHADTVAEWERLIESGEHPGGVRLRLRKTATKKPGLLWSEALDVALCFGWIDGQRDGLDDEFYLQSYGPRTVRSPWSQINQGHVARLIAEGRMREGGQAEIDRAKGDGRWDAAYRQKDAPVPDDLRAALDASPAAAEFFEKLSSQNRFAILFRIGSVKRAETRERKIATFVAMLERGETIYPQKRV